MKKRLFGGTIVLVLYIIMILILWVASSNAADYATYMRIVKFHGSYVVAVDEDGQRWDIETATSKSPVPLYVGDHILVIMDLSYVPEEGKFVIGHAYIQGKL